MKTKVIGKRPAPQTPAEFYSLGARLDRELAVVRPFMRKKGFVVKARTWEEMATWENQRVAAEARQSIRR